MTHSSTDVALFTHNCSFKTLIMSTVWSYIEHTVGQEEVSKCQDAQQCLY